MSPTLSSAFDVKARLVPGLNFAWFLTLQEIKFIVFKKKSHSHTLVSIVFQAHLLAFFFQDA